MSIWTRASISFNGGKPYEDTDTLVLNGHTYFVDMRVQKGTKPPALHVAFAGTKTIVPNPDGTVHWTWEHAVDTSSRDPGVDEGDVSRNPTDPGRIIERGQMTNPATGREEDGEEVWLEKLLPGGTRIAFLEREDGDAFIGMIGGWKLGVGWDWAWRVDNGIPRYKIGGCSDGMDIRLGQGTTAGDRVGKWIVREFWETHDVSH